MTFRIAVLQKSPECRDIAQRTDLVLSYMEEGAKNQADLLLLPECFLTGYVFPVTNQDALSEKSAPIQRLQEGAKKLGIGVVATAFTKGEKKPQNSAFVMDKSGRILMRYAKVHTCDFADEAGLEGGSEFSVCDFHGVKLGVMICYDREYPESARILMLKGAEIILVPNDCASMRPRVTALSTRAYENMVGVVMANPNGENKGNSCAFLPMCWDEEGKCVDNTLFLADEMSEGLYYAVFDLEALRAYRSREMMGNTFRKVKAYAPLLSPEIGEPFIRDNQVSFWR